ncbi:hypothetical protein [Membranihabitans marinus]|uniref:hypothetical protein n=1 Tax=Membranihabitans marinus TaxID=1227546 RepID=UPI001F374A49|nr:hypothetical protein [Membranihabitans marinus]
MAATSLAQCPFRTLGASHFARSPTHDQWSWFPHQMSIKDIWLPFGQLYSVILAKGRFTTFDPSDFARSSSSIAMPIGISNAIFVIC